MNPLCGIRNCQNEAVPALYIETELETGDVGRVNVCAVHLLRHKRQERLARRRHPARTISAATG